ncbi:hypothetical protein MBM_00067 [Drepanopeziza brunnea f. sp. 'multigermtubi' MB_m1]|uniref:Uncharacterized protein n=1 Tax=Marssonina brunnea f. sp. multigermtubi (strain MB_m1) TaxID=1072389 RepID=K1Y6X8_MARBU|nr:uncharacterized protein MBM_00067 [Drepanopeziza brunnea f. sp. 'multigermtubi' MB_m1]EKD20954.1 hypothetical protein MBM_00067 [Drepanopeziza brunnea f. sp. 'multigermtubi' MB_m1]
MADRATGFLGGESSRQGAVRYYTLRVLLPPTEPLAIQPKQTLYLGLLSLSEGPDDEMSGILFDLNELPYARLDSEITARAMVRDFLDAKCRGLRDYDLWSLFRHAFLRWDWTSFTMTRDNTGRGLKRVVPLKAKGLRQWDGQALERRAAALVDPREDKGAIGNTFRSRFKVDRRKPYGRRGYYTLTTSTLAQSKREGKGGLKQEGRRGRDSEVTRRVFKGKERYGTKYGGYSKANGGITDLPEFSKNQDRVATKTVLRSSSDQIIIEATRAIRQKRTRQNLRAFRTKSALTRDSVQISVPSLSNSRGGSSTFGRTGKLLISLKRLRINKRETKARALAGDPNDLSDLSDDRRRGNGGDWQGDRGHGYGKGRNGPSRLLKGFGNGPLKDPGSGNEPLRDPGRGRTIGNYIGNPVPIRLLAKHGTLAYGTLSAFDDDRDDFSKLRATDPHLKAKELALFARSFLKELKLPTFKANAIAVRDHFETDHRRQAKYDRLKDDRSLADKLYSACKNVPETTIARMNPAFTFTAAVVDIRRAIAFATKTSRPLAKARAYASSSELHDHTCFQHASEADSDLDEEYECFIQDRQYFEEFDQFIVGLLDEPLESGSYANMSEGFVITHGTFDANEVYKQLEIQTAFHAFTSQVET